MKRLLLVFFALSMVAGVRAAEFTCGTDGVNNSCTPSLLQSRIDSASAGDVIRIAQATHAWSTPVTITKGLTIIGGGSYSVDGNHNDVGNWPTTLNLSGNTALIMNSSSGDLLRITGLEFSGVSTDVYGCAQVSGVIYERENNSTRYRIDNCRFDIAGGSSLHTRSYNAYGLLDHTFHFNPNRMTHWIMVYRCGGSRVGDESFTDPVDLGGPTFLFVEDNHFVTPADGTATPSVIDAQGGGRYVFRHNYVEGSFALMHGTESGAPERGGYVSEVYENEFNWPDPSWRYPFAYYNRGGVFLFHNNTCRNFTHLVRTWVHRVDQAFGRFGKCDGSNSLDGNWGGTYPPGYPCLDQTGRGQAFGAATTQPQAAMKSYIWNNTTVNVGSTTGPCTITDDNFVCHNNPTYVVRGRDYEYSADSSAKPAGYTTYAYPHPLTLPQGSKPSAPTNLRVVGQ